MAHPNTFLRFPGGLEKALSFTFDDGTVGDRRLADRLGELGLRATFNINSGWFGLVLPYNKRMSAEETVAALDRDFIEIACHGSKHADPSRIDAPTLLWDALNDRNTLEHLFRRPVTGYAYPQGAYSPNVMRDIERAGFEYARGLGLYGDFRLPDDLFELHATCTLLSDNCDDLIGRFVSLKCGDWIWGGDTQAAFMNIFCHSYEFGDDEAVWQSVFGRLGALSGHGDIWYATNIEIVRYIRAFRSLVFSLEHDWVYNPSAIPVWIYREGGVARLDPGVTTAI